MKSEIVERESLSKFFGVRYSELASTAGFHIIAFVGSCACLIESVRSQLFKAGPFIYPSTLSNG